MKRIVVCVVLTVTLVLAATAIAAVKSYQGKISEDSRGTVAFDGVKKNGKIVKVKHYIFHFAPATCADGQHTFTNESIPIAAKVKHRHFHKQLSLTNGSVKVGGEFTHKYRKADGTIKFSGDIGTGTSCSGTDHWTAKRG